MGQWPVADKFLRHNPLLLWLERKGVFQGSTFPLVPLVAKNMRERVKYYQTKEEPAIKEREDLLDKFLHAKETHPHVVTEREVLSLSLTMILAGAETTLESLIYPCLKACHR